MALQKKIASGTDGRAAAELLKGSVVGCHALHWKHWCTGAAIVGGKVPSLLRRPSELKTGGPTHHQQRNHET